MFEGLFRRARHRRSFSECSLLIRLVNEYEPLLSARERAVVAYNEGKLASDLLQWEHALDLFEGVAVEPDVDDETRASRSCARGMRCAPCAGRTMLWPSSRTRGAAARLPARPGARSTSWVSSTATSAKPIAPIARCAPRSTTRRRPGTEPTSPVFSTAWAPCSSGCATPKRRSTRSQEPGGARTQWRRRASGCGAQQPGAGADRATRLVCSRNFLLRESRAQAGGRRSARAGRRPPEPSRAQTAQGKLALAQESAAQAGALYQAVGDARGEARAFLTQARLAKREGQAEAARSLFQQAAERATTAGDGAMAGRAREELGRI